MYRLSLHSLLCPESPLEQSNAAQKWSHKLRQQADPYIVSPFGEQSHHCAVKFAASALVDRLIILTVPRTAAWDVQMHRGSRKIEHAHLGFSICKDREIRHGETKCMLEFLFAMGAERHQQ
jgi:hypothetical protein